jgi:hypothetical protein
VLRSPQAICALRGGRAGERGAALAGGAAGGADGACAAGDWLAGAQWVIASATSSTELTGRHVQGANRGNT